MPSRPLSKAEKSLLVTCGILLIPLSAIAFFYMGRDAEPAWNIPPAAPRPNPNGYDLYVAAAKATVRFSPEVDPASDTTVNPPNSPYALKNYSLPRRQQWLQANARTFALVNQGLVTPSMSPDDIGVSMAEWRKLRQLARDMSTRTRTFQMQNQPMRATMSALDTMQMGQDSTRGGNIVASLVGIAIGAIGRDPLEDWNKTINSLSATEARTAARRLEALIAHDSPVAQAISTERRFGLTQLRLTFATPGWRRQIIPQTSSSLEENISKLLQLQTISKRRIYDNTNRAFDTAIANTKLPYSRARTAPLPPNLDTFSESFASVTYRFGLNQFRHTMTNNMLLLRLALCAYIAEHKAAPPTLAALAPSYLKTVPTDVYNDGKPLFYTPQGKTYKLWSVGPDGINNGGVPLSRRPNSKLNRPAQNTLNNTGDFVAGLCR